jgi:hypothetical protein
MPAMMVPMPMIQMKGVDAAEDLVERAHVLHVVLQPHRPVVRGVEVVPLARYARRPLLGDEAFQRMLASLKLNMICPLRPGR